MKSTLKIFLIFVLISFCFIFSSCEFFSKITQNDNYVTSVSFKNEKYILYIGEADVCYVEASPSDSFDWYETKYDIDDSEICKIEAVTNKYCIVRALKTGSSILTVKIGNKEGKCVVTVRSEP